MKRDWKPGDVAMIEGEGSAWIGIVRVSSVAGRPLEFAYGNGGFDYVNDVATGFTARPLVVIDPEDREQVERLEAVLAEAGVWPVPHNEPRVRYMQAALREFADPKPRIEEPKGWGAVVEDGTAAYWTLYAPDAGVWINYREGKRRWHEIDAVRVVSEGVRDA